LQELGAIVMDTATAVDNRVISCQGPGASLQVSFLLLEAMTGREHCQEVQRLMCYP
jgi:hypothetical protein